MTPQLLTLAAAIGTLLVAALRQAIREELRAILLERRSTDREVARYFHIHVKTWRRTHAATPDLRKSAGVLFISPGGAARWRWRIADVEHYLSTNQTDIVSLWKAAREKARKGQGAAS